MASARAAGTTLIGAVYFAVGTAVDPDRGAVAGLLVTAGIIAVALAASALDLRTRSSQGRVAPASSAARPEPT